MSDERKAAFNFYQEELANDLNEEKKKTDERIKRHLDIVIRIAGDFHSTLKSERDDIHAEQGEFRSEDLRELFDTVDYFVKNLNQKRMIKKVVLQRVTRLKSKKIMM